MFALVVVLVTEVGLIIAPDAPAFERLDRCHEVAQVAVSGFAAMQGVIAVRYRCVVLSFPDARGA